MVNLNYSTVKNILYITFLFLAFTGSSYSKEQSEQSKFGSTNLSDADCNYLLSKKVITESNPVPCHRLSKITFSYLNEKGDIKNDGILVVLDILAPKVEKIMKKLLENNFIIFRVRPIEEYNGDDKASMSDNNTSSFNGRPITGGSSWSLHAYGAAIDINPVQNPFIEINEDGSAKISPEKSARFAVNRLNQRPGKPSHIGMAEEIVDIFAEHGFFVWGGYWDYPIDYQHFQVGPRSFVEALIKVSPDEGEQLLDKYINMYINCRENMKDVESPDKIRAQCIDYVISEMP